MPRHLILDVEAVAINDVATYLEPVSAPSHYKDEAKIAEYIAAKKAELTEKAALDIDLARIVCIGYHMDGLSPSQTLTEAVIIKDELQEREVLGRFWQTFWPVYVPGSTVAVTFNGLSYDMPLLLRRSLYLGVTAPKLQLDRYKHVDVVDLLAILSNDGRQKMHSQRFYAQRFGIQVDDELTGADIGAAVAAGDWAAVEKHCAADVATTKALAKRMDIL